MANFSGKLGQVGLLGALAWGCGDGPSQPAQAGGTPATVEIATGNQQTGNAGEAVTIPPSVVVKNAGGGPVANVAVQFTVVSGAGTVQRTQTQTDANGIATAGSWTLGALPGVNSLDASVSGLPAVRFTATAQSPFNITVRYIGTPSSAQKAAVDAAVARWRSVIIRDIPDWNLNARAQDCFTGQPAINESVDDILLYVDFATIDGVGKVLGATSVCYIRTSSSLPVMGYLQLDVADAARLEASGSLNDVVLHEMSHVLGFGVIWSNLNLITGKGGSSPAFTGPHALAAYKALGGAAAAVPVENTGATGTRDSHWRESVFGIELMTGFVSGARNPLSTITIASLQDLGYTVNDKVADTYAIANASLVARTSFDTGATEEIVGGPRRSVMSNGTVVE